MFFSCVHMPPCCIKVQHYDRRRRCGYCGNPVNSTELKIDIHSQNAVTVVALFWLCIYKYSVTHLVDALFLRCFNGTRRVNKTQSTNASEIKDIYLIKFYNMT